MLSILQVLGSLVVLAAFIAAQTRRLVTSGRRYLALNAAGSGVLTFCAVVEAQWGFLLLEGVWALVSVLGLIRALGRPSPAASPSASASS